MLVVVLLAKPRVDGAGVVRLAPEEISVVLTLEVCVGEGAVLLRARMEGQSRRWEQP